ncbi:unnamed protein product [Amoebophrya sp. A120]|nr:unnamed protein product [Amoebophrya sp. A120]|eukprot:GSA120T00002563001.1
MAAARGLSEQNIRICCRIRPVTIGEQEAQSSTAVQQEDARNLVLYDPRHKGVSRRFQFDRVYCEEHTETIFQEEIAPHVRGLFAGNHLTVFAHGASGSGKTFTMEGVEPDCQYGGLGITPQSVAMIFHHLDSGDVAPQDYEVRFSLYEIYCEKVRDLLQDVDPQSKGRDSKYDVTDLPIQKDLAGFEIIPDLTEVIVESTEQFWHLYQKRIRLRKKGRTLLNEESSRSHAFCVLKVVKKQKENKANALARRPSGASSMTFHERPRPPQTGRLFLVDLAGCEDNRMSGNSGIRMLESQAINDTYLALVKVFHALKRRQGLSAFCRDAKLTRLLRGALESKASPCLVMITVSPSRFRFQATQNTFSYLQLNGAPLGGAASCAEIPALPLANLNAPPAPANQVQKSHSFVREALSARGPEKKKDSFQLNLPQNNSNLVLQRPPSYSARKLPPPSSARPGGRGTHQRGSVDSLKDAAGRAAYSLAGDQNRMKMKPLSAQPSRRHSFTVESEPKILRGGGAAPRSADVSMLSETNVRPGEVGPADDAEDLDEDWKNARRVEVDEYESFNLDSKKLDEGAAGQVTKVAREDYVLDKGNKETKPGQLQQHLAPVPPSAPGPADGAPSRGPSPRARAQLSSSPLVSVDSPPGLVESSSLQIGEKSASSSFGAEQPKMLKTAATAAAATAPGRSREKLVSSPAKGDRTAKKQSGCAQLEQPVTALPQAVATGKSQPSKVKSSATLQKQMGRGAVAAPSNGATEVLAKKRPLHSKVKAGGTSSRDFNNGPSSRPTSAGVAASRPTSATQQASRQAAQETGSTQAADSRVSTAAAAPTPRSPQSPNKMNWSMGNVPSRPSTAARTLSPTQMAGRKPLAPATAASSGTTAPELAPPAAGVSAAEGVGLSASSGEAKARARPATDLVLVDHLSESATDNESCSRGDAEHHSSVHSSEAYSSSNIPSPEESTTSSNHGGDSGNKPELLSHDKNDPPFVHQEVGARAPAEQQKNASTATGSADDFWRDNVVNAVQENLVEISNLRTRNAEKKGAGESVKEFRAKQSKIRQPQQHFKAAVVPVADEIRNGMRSCLRPPTNVRKNKEDLSTSKIVRNYFQPPNPVDL